jgi:hypothetical protein
LSDKRKKAEGETLQAAAEGASRGLTLGLSDQLLAGALGAPYKGADGKWYSGNLEIPSPDAAGALDRSSELAARKEANPLAAGAGEFAGMLVNPASRISGAARTARGAVALGSIEGGLFGLGSALTEDALGDPEALHEHIAARVGGGALMGGVVSGAVHKVLGGLERVTLSEEASKLPEVLKGFSEKASSTLRKSAITDDAALRKAGIEWSDLHKWGQEQGLFHRATTADGLFEQADVAAQNADSLMGAAALKLDELGQPNLEKLAKAAAKFGDDEVLSMVSPGLASKARALSKKLDRVDPGVGAADEQTITWPKLAEVLKGLDQQPSSQPIADALRKEALRQADKLDPGAASSLERAFKGRTYANFLKGELSGAGKPLDVSSVAGNAAVAGLWGGPGAAVGSAASQLLGREAQRRGPMLAANLLEKIPDASVLKPLAESLFTQIKARLNLAPELLGPFRVTLENAAAGGADQLLATHLQLAQGENGDEYLSTLGLQREGADAVKPLAEKAQAMSAVMKLQSSIKLQLEEAVKGLDRTAETDLSASERDYKTAYDAVQRLVQAPPVDDKLSALPATQMGLTEKLAAAAKHLYDLAPRDPNEHLPPALRPAWKPTAMEEQRFLARTQAAFEPLQAISAILRGEPAQERLATLAALYPRLMEQTTEKLFERLNQNKPLSWIQRQRLVPFLGPEAVGLSPQQVAILASTHHQAAQGAQPESRVDGRQVVDQSKNQETQTQRIEARRSKA